MARYELEQNNFDGAIVILAQALPIHRPDTDPALPVVMDYYLGEALMREGFDGAAAAQLADYLDAQNAFSRTTRYYRELAVLYEQRAAIWLVVGDADLRLGRLSDALTAYRRADRPPPR